MTETKKETQLKALFDTIRARDINGIQKLLEDATFANVDVNALKETFDENGDIFIGTPLNLAVKIGHEETVKVLLESQQPHFFDPNPIGDNHESNLSVGTTPPLCVAAMVGGKIMIHTDDNKAFRLTRMLLEHGADPNIPCYTGETAVYKAAAYSFNLEVVRLLLQYGADPALGTDNDYGQNVLHRLLPSVHHNRVLKIFQLFLQHGANPNLENSSGKTLLGMAVRNHWNHAIHPLLRAGASLTQKYCAEDDNLPPFSWLLREAWAWHVVNSKKCPEPPSTERKRFMQIMDAIRTMLKHGAAKSKKVMSNEQGRQLLFLAAACGDHAVVKHVLNRGICCDEANEDGETALVVSAERGNVECVRILLQHGANPNMSCKCNGKSPLVASVEIENRICALELLENGADANMTCEDGRTPLAAGVARRNPHCAQLLLEHGADPNKRGKDGRFPLMIAIENGCVTSALSLYDAGAMPSLIKLRDDRAALAFLAIEKAQDEVQMLQRDDKGNVVELELKWMTPYQIRPELFKLSHLQSLALHNIRWSFRISEELSALKNLKTLELLHLPAGMQNLANLETLIVSRPQKDGVRPHLKARQFDDLPPNLKHLHVRNYDLDSVPSALPSTLHCLDLQGCGIRGIQSNVNFPASLHSLLLGPDLLSPSSCHHSTLIDILERHEHLQMLFFPQHANAHEPVFTPQILYLSTMNRVCGKDFIRSNTAIPTSCWATVLGKVRDACKYGLPRHTAAETEASVLFTLLRESIAVRNVAHC